MIKNNFNISSFLIDLVRIVLLSKVNNTARARAVSTGGWQEVLLRSGAAAVLTGSWLGVLLLSGAAVATGREPFTAPDLWNWRTVRDAQISSDGRRVVYAEEWNDQEKDAAWSNLWLATSDGKQRQRLTEGPWRDDWPRWSPDGESIAYRSNRAGGAGIRVRRLDSGADSLIAGGNPDSLAWSPDGRWIAFTAWVPRNMPPDWAPAAALARLVSDTSGSAEIFVTPAGGGAARQITHDSFVRRGTPSWTPDGRRILNAAERAPDAANPLEGAEIYSVQVADGAVRRLTEHAGPDENPVVSPDGRKVAWIRADTKPPGYAIRKLYVMNADGSRAKVLTGSLDRDAMAPAVELGFAHGVFSGRRSGFDARVCRAQRRHGPAGDQPGGTAERVLAGGQRAGGDGAVDGHRERQRGDVCGGPARRGDHGGCAQRCAAGRARHRTGGGSALRIRRQERPRLAGEAATDGGGQAISAAARGAGRSARHVRPGVWAARADSGSARAAWCCASIRAARPAMARISAICCARGFRATISTT